jgi:hypothetical protein
VNRFLFLLLLSCFFLPHKGDAQTLTNQRKRAVFISKKADTLRIDTLSIIPGTLSLAIRYLELDSTEYTVLPEDGEVVLNRAKLDKLGFNVDSLTCTYKVFPYLFSKTLQHKDNSIVHPILYNNEEGYMYQVGPTSTSNDPFDLGTLSKSGSISRGISFGNNQNLNTSSSLNLQLAGKLSNNVNVLVAATDDNLPIQPEGNTTQLQDFDKVFVKLYDTHTSLIAGDYEIASPTGYFMRFNEKAEGGLFSTRFITKANRDTAKAGIMKITVGGGIAKGEYSENTIAAIDGNMGPYRLTGANGETFIVVLSGTEKVYLDGQLLQRGQSNDYTIDYNAAQLTFTPKHLISASSQIVIDFQYSDLTYERSIMHIATDYHEDNLTLRFNLYSEQDAKNQQLSQSLSSSQEQFLSSLGNNIQNAFVPGAASSTYSNSQVQYREVDSTVGAIIYGTTPGTDSVFVYCPDSIITAPKSSPNHFTVSFSQVTQGQGDYIQIQSAANGNVYQWTAPVSSVHQGNYIAKVLLITPKQKQMITAGGDYRLGKYTSISMEGAVTNNDVNTFSSFGKSQDVGYAGHFLFHNTAYLVDSTSANKGNVWRLQTNLSYEGVNQNFSPIERYRSVDFATSWNLTNDSVLASQNLMDANFLFGNKKDQIGYDFQTFLEGAEYNATKQTATVKLNELGFITTLNGSLLQTKSLENTSNYYKEAAVISHKLFYWVGGVGESAEKDIFRSRATGDSIIGTNSTLFEQASNYQFYEWDAFIKTPDTAKRSYGIDYSERTDYGADIEHNEMVKSLFTRNLSLNAAFLRNPKSRFKANVTYHIMQVLADSTIAAGQTPVNALVGQAEYDASLLKGVINSTTFYQAGSGLQPKEDYTYVQVPAGTGVYAWTDYNHDGIQELNEFYIAPYQDEADYIRVYTPTTNYEKVYTSGFTETFNLRPAAAWNSKKGIRKFLSLFSEQLALHSDRKTTSTNPLDAYNPFIQNTSDTNVIGLNSSLRNTVYFNQLNPHFGMDYTYSSTSNKTVLEEDGGQARVGTYQDLHARVGLSTKWIVEGEGKVGADISNSEFFPTDNFDINYYQIIPKLNFQPNTSFRITYSFTYSDKVNALSDGGGTSTQENNGIEIKYNVLTKGSLTANFNYVKIAFNGDPSSALGLEMMQGLNIGNNYTWGISYQCNLSGNIQLNLSYTGRAEPGSPIVNTGNASVRAFF